LVLANLRKSPDTQVIFFVALKIDSCHVIENNTDIVPKNSLGVVKRNLFYLFFVSGTYLVHVPVYAVD